MERISLSKFDLNDFNLYNSLVSNEQVMKMITERSLPLEEAHKKFNNIILRNRKYDLYGTFKVYNNAMEFIGLGSLTLNEEKKEEAELGYMLLPEYWGQRLGSAIAEALIDKAIKTNVTRLTAVIDPNNVPSRNILIRRGFHSEKVCNIAGLPGEILSKTI